MSMLSYSITGDEAIDAALAAVSATTRKKAIQEAIKKAEAGMLAYIKANTPQDTGKLQKAIKFYVGRPKKNKGAIFVNVGPNIYSEKKKIYKKKQKMKESGQQMSSGQTRKELIRMDSNALLKWIEYGATWRTGERAGKTIMKGLHLMRRAHDAYGPQAAEAVKGFIIDMIYETLNKKIARKQAKLGA